VQRYPRFAAEAFDKNRALVERVSAMAARRGVTAAQLVLAWLLAQGQDIVPIPGTKRRTYLEEDVGALAVHLTTAQIKELEMAVPEQDVIGARYPTPAMQAVDR
jgi:aryl-alcohol dehydrogenase-like predicted oxidoreductase